MTASLSLARLMTAFNAFIDDKAAGMMSSQFQYTSAGIILCMCPANERRRYIVTSSPIGWAHTQNDPC